MIEKPFKMGRFGLEAVVTWRSYMKRDSNPNLFGNEGYCAYAVLLLVKIMLCGTSSPKSFKLQLLSYKIAPQEKEFSRRESVDLHDMIAATSTCR